MAGGLLRHQSHTRASSEVLNVRGQLRPRSFVPIAREQGGITRPRSSDNALGASRGTLVLSRDDNCRLAIDGKPWRNGLSRIPSGVMRW